MADVKDIKEIRFVEAPADPNKGFRIGHTQSVFQNNVTFHVTGYKFGSYSIERKNGSVESTKYADSAQSIVLTTSVDEDLPLNRLLHKKDVLYDATGSAHVEHACSFQGDLMRHMLALGRRDDDSAMLKGSVEDVAKHALKFFDGKDLLCKEISGFAKDEKGKLQDRISPFIQFGWKE
jgi:hypothetical protein